ncbi:MAG TPA: helix-hairpin-helix domain-containing protein, partial [Acidimicrobiia bacterium]|nr:helix-hairpin-helix domain-containing protein [Acidimicrobiia bacterium]
PWEVAMTDRFAVVWHRIRSGEDPLAFGAVVVALALSAGGLWFWAGVHHGGVGAAAASPAPAGETARRPEAGTGRPGDGAGRSGDGAGRSGSAAPHSGDGGGPPPIAAGAGATGTGPGAVSTLSGPALAVHVAGAVAHPGLYHLEGGARVADAVARAGGGLARADLDRLNLAARLVDGQKVYVARRGEPGPPPLAGLALGDGSPGDEAGPESTEPIDLNAAGLAALDSLPGIGPATARAILEERARRRGFRSTRDLLRVAGIGEGRFARLKDRVRV